MDDAKDAKKRRIDEVGGSITDEPEDCSQGNCVDSISYNNPDSVMRRKFNDNLDDFIDDITDDDEPIEQSDISSHPSAETLKNMLKRLKASGTIAMSTTSARLILNKIRTYLNENAQHAGVLDQVTRLLNSDIGVWDAADLDAVANVPIPMEGLIDYDKRWKVVGFGDIVSTLVKDANMEIRKKSVTIRGWQEICRMKTNGTTITLIQPPKPGNVKSSDVVLDILERVRTGIIGGVQNRVVSMRITEEDRQALNESIPWGEEISKYPLLLCIKQITTTGSTQEKIEALNSFKQITTTNFPGWILSSKESVAVQLNDELRQLYIDPATGDIVCNSEISMYHARCNAGCLKFIHETLNKIYHVNADGIGYLYVGSVIMRLKQYTNNAAFNTDVIRCFLKDIYKQIRSKCDRDSGTLGVTRDGIDSIYSLQKMKAYVDSTGIAPTNEQIQDFIEGCIILNYCSQVLSYQPADIPASVREYLGDTLDNQVPGAYALPQARGIDGTVDLYNEFAAMYRPNVFKLNLNDFPRSGGGDYTFVGPREDIAVFRRYANDSNFYTVPYRLSGAFMCKLVEVLGEGGIGSVIEGGMACMLRYNQVVTGHTRYTCNKFIHCSSSAFEVNEIAAFTGRYRRHPQPADVIRTRLQQNAAGHALIPTLQAAYSNALGRNVNFQPRVNHAFAELRAGRCRNALSELCAADLVFADNILIFGLAVFMRKFVENRRQNRGGNHVFDVLFQNPSWDRRLTRAVVYSTFKDDDIDNYWNILSVIIHSWDGGPSGANRFANFTTKDRYYPIFKWEVLTLFFYFTGRTLIGDGRIELGIAGREGRRVPVLTALQTIDSLVDRLHKLTIISTDDDNHDYYY